MPIVKIEKWGDNYRLCELFGNDDHSPPRPQDHTKSPRKTRKIYTTWRNFMLPNKKAIISYIQDLCPL
jgi:hypothetical protein